MNGEISKPDRVFTTALLDLRAGVLDLGIPS
jgi:hypothetical protein